MKKQLLFIILLLCCTLVLAQSSQNGKVEKQDTTVQKKVDFNVMPYLSYNRNLKFMIGAIPMAMYRLNQADTISPKSLSGLAAVYTTNGSYFISIFNRWYLAEDTWRIKMFAVTGDHNSQFYMDDLDAPGFYDYGTNTTLVSVGAQRKIAQKLFVGVTYTYANYHTTYEDGVQPESTTQTNGLELNLMLDTRDAVYYPMTGVNSKLRFIAYPEWFGNDVSANKILTEYNRYFPMKNGKDVLAARFSGTFGLGDIAFEQQVTLGGKDIRGYSEGKYRADGQMAIQGEYRYNFGEKMGVVGFAGLATIYGSDTESFNWKMYPGLGVGYRYRAFKTVKFNIGLDAAVGKDDWGIYFRIGEAF
ncbi:BamA/TamA family outer membrane protein [Algoriphagus winogradskyi]|uniref:BamA/TamA family outer membrane protein n=1 Tax=Algoriphagus winogradskyi TaxID=237017 RepID=UPI0024B78C24|nr:BamA/TamA family outer membrane protein [Algoriphagus winogradskyi]